MTASHQLAASLLELSLLEQDDIEEALQRQVVQGGSLDTNLMEMGVVTEEHLLQALGHAYQMPQVNKSAIDSIPAHIPRLFPLVFAETYHLVPCALAEQQLTVLSSAPPDAELYSKIHERFKLSMSPAVTTEVRLHYAMHRLYGISLLPRIVDLLNHLDGEVPEPMSGVEVKPSRVLSWGVSGKTITQDATQGTRADVRAFLSRLDEADTRDAIVEVLLEATLTTFEYAGIFLVQGGTVHGWRGINPASTEKISQVRLPVTDESVFNVIHSTRGHYLGPLQHNPIHQQLLQQLEREYPRAAFLAPITVGGKLAAILYGDNGRVGVSSKKVAAILLLAHRAGTALESLIRSRRKDAASGASVEPVVAPAEVPNLETPKIEAGVPVAAAQVEAGVSQSVAVTEAEEAAEAPQPAGPQLIDVSELTDADEELELDEVEVEVEPAENDWSTVKFEDYDATSATGHFDQDPSLDATSVQFERGIRDASSSMPAELEVDLEDLQDDVDDVDVEVEVEEETSGDYVAFSEVSDNPDESLDQWEDVLVDTVSEPGISEADHAPNVFHDETAASVTWEQVIAATRDMPTLQRAEARKEETQVEVAGTVVNERELLFDGLEATDPEVRRGAIERLTSLGSAIDEELFKRFPGNVVLDPFADNTRLVPFNQCSGLAALLQARGTSAAGLVAPHLDSEDPRKRFFAIYFFRAVRYSPAIESLAKRLYDSEPRNRHMAADALRRYADEEAYGTIIANLREQLGIPVPDTQVSTIQILGQLREPGAVPSLIPLVRSRHSVVAHAAASALALICAQTHGLDIQKWSNWWRSHYQQPREAWLVEGLRNPHQGVPELADAELQLLTGMRSSFGSSQSQQQREEAIRAWETWWRRTSSGTASALSERPPVSASA